MLCLVIQLFFFSMRLNVGSKMMQSSCRNLEPYTRNDIVREMTLMGTMATFFH